MSEHSNQLSATQISKVTDMISADHSLRFCTEYLRIDRNQYKTIEYDANFNHHDTLFQCIEMWKNKMERGLDAREHLIELLMKIQKEKGWFSRQDMAFLFDGESVKMSQTRKRHNCKIEQCRYNTGD